MIYVRFSFVYFVLFVVKYSLIYIVFKVLHFFFFLLTTKSIFFVRMLFCKVFYKEDTCWNCRKFTEKDSNKKKHDFVWSVFIQDTSVVTSSSVGTSLFTFNFIITFAFGGNRTPRFMDAKPIIKLFSFYLAPFLKYFGMALW